jgi:hypothetical protein
MARLTRKNRNKHHTRRHRARSYSKLRSRTRRGGYYEITSKREARKYLKDYAKEAPYLENDPDIEIYDPELDPEEPDSGYRIPPPRPNRFTGKVDTSDITGIKKSWNPFSRFTRKNKLQRTGPKEIPRKPLPIIKSIDTIDSSRATLGSDDIDSLTYDSDDDLGDIYEEVRADQQAPLLKQAVPQEKPSFFSRLFGKGQAQAPAVATEGDKKKPWYQFWGGETIKSRKSRRSRRSRRTRRAKK